MKLVMTILTWAAGLGGFVPIGMAEQSGLAAQRGSVGTSPFVRQTAARMLSLRCLNWILRIMTWMKPVCCATAAGSSCLSV